MESILSTNPASKSTVKLPIAAPAQTKAPVPTVTNVALAKAGTVSPSAIVSPGKPQADLGLYAPAKASAPGQAAKGDALETSAGGVVAGKDRIVVDIEASDSGYNNRIFYSTDNFKTKQYLGVDNQTGSVDLGTFKPGTTIQFGIDNGQGDFFKTGGKAANADNVDHTQVSKLADGSVRVGFEDLRGGGDRDFNDAIIKVRSVPAVTAPMSAPPAAPAAPAATAGAVKLPTLPATAAIKPFLPPPVPVAAKPVAPEPKPAATPVAVKPTTPEIKPPATPVAASPANPAAKPPATPVPATPAVKPPAATVTANPATPAVKPSATAVATSTTTPAVKATPAAPATPAVKTTPAATVPAAAVNGNRSGLGDGTNPGQGAGTIKSPNQGTLNPGGMK